MAEGQQQAATPPFALTPARARVGVLDYTRDTDADIYKDGSKPISPLFDLDKDNLRCFLNKVANRVQKFNWNNICFIRVGNESRNLLMDYGQIALTDVHNQAQQWLGQPTRNAQNSQMMYECLSNSLTKAAFDKVSAEADSYTYTMGDQQYEDGPSFLKCIISETEVDTRATTSLVRYNLSTLDKYMVTVKYDIIAFNEYVKDQRKVLVSRGEDVTKHKMVLEISNCCTGVKNLLRRKIFS